MFSGCTILRYEDMAWVDKSFGKFMIENNTGYRIELHGPVETTLMPGESYYGNVTRCTGRFKGVAYVYRIIGGTKSGELVTTYMGYRTFYINIDWRNYEYRGESPDSRVQIAGFSRPTANRLVSSPHIAPYEPCLNFLVPRFELKPG